MSHQNSTISVNTIEPQSGTTLTIGNAGQDVVVNADSIKNNVWKDAGGNALFTSNGSGVLSGINSGFGSAEVLLATEIVSTPVVQVDFTSGIDNTYPLYRWDFINIHPSSEEYWFRFQVNAVGESGFDEYITSTLFTSRIGENGAQAMLYYADDDDQAQGTAYQAMSGPGANRDFESASGYLYLANPSGTTYAKNFWGRQNSANWDSYTWNNYVAGYINTTAAIDEISFRMEGGNIDAGKIKMYGIK